MTEELKKENLEEKNECCSDCNCKCAALKKFLLLIFASFLGTLVALCLFSAVVKPKVPPMPPVPQMRGPVQVKHFNQENFNRQRNRHPDARIRRIEARPQFNGEEMPRHFEHAPGGRPVRGHFDEN